MRGRKRITLYLTELDYNLLRQILADNGTSRAEIMRRRLHVEWWGQRETR